MALPGFTRVAEGYNGLQRLHGVTGGYKGLQEVTRGYRGLEEVTRGDRKLQEVTKDYKGLQLVTRGYSGLQGVKSRRSWRHMVSENEPFRNHELCTTDIDQGTSISEIHNDERKDPH